MLNLGEMWKQEWLAEGLAEGRVEGRAEGALAMLEKLVRQKFGEPLPERLARKTDLDLLARLNFAAACADTMSAFEALAAGELGKPPEKP